jgi:hypothetical protein
LAQAKAADPTHKLRFFVFSASLPASSSAFKEAADDIIAVPCFDRHALQDIQLLY